MKNKYQDQISYWKRDEFGLLPNIEYIFNEDTKRVEWRKMIPSKFLVPNREKFSKDTNFNNIDITQLDDSKLLILLGGIRFLSSLRGYNYVKQNIVTASGEYVAATCEIELIPNFETDMRPIIFTGEGDAHFNNTHSFAKNFLTCIACNRSFVRAWRNALEISVLGQDELGLPINEETKLYLPPDLSPTSPHAVLIQKLQEKGKTFTQLKARLSKEGIYTQEVLNSWNVETDIPITPDVWNILKILK